MKRIYCLLLLANIAAGYQAPAPTDPEQVWRAYISWFRKAPFDGNPVQGYVAELQKEGASKEEVQRRTAIIMKLFAERSEGVEAYFDHVFSKPITGTPELDGFSSAPSTLLVEAVRGLNPGTALDAGMGQGRNAVYLAREGWEVTGFDISSEALAVARSNAEKAGVRMNAVKAGYDRFDFGVEKWDLIVLAFAWAPVSDPSFVGRIRTSLRPGGRVVFEHMITKGGGPQANIVRQLLPGQLRTCFSDFEIVRYEETEGMGDWGGPGSQLVRMVARKR